MTTQRVSRRIFFRIDLLPGSASADGDTQWVSDDGIDNAVDYIRGCVRVAEFLGVDAARMLFAPGTDDRPVLALAIRAADVSNSPPFGWPWEPYYGNQSGEDTDIPF